MLAYFFLSDSCLSKKYYLCYVEMILDTINQTYLLYESRRVTCPELL